MSDLGKVLTVSLTLYVLVAGVFLLLENRRPQATLAWLLAFVFIPGVGVRVYLYEKGYLHAKTISIDSEVCSIGSANIDIRSFSINYELNAVLYSEQIAGELEATFERDLAFCTEFDPAEYQRRNPVVRFRDSVARLLSPLL